jgi:TonB family protein
LHHGYAAVGVNDPTGCKFSTVDRRTVLEFQVDRGGTITRVRVVKSSGVDYLDQVAVDTMVRIGRMDPPLEPDLFKARMKSVLTPQGETAEVVQLPFAFTVQSRRAPEKCGNQR